MLTSQTMISTSVSAYDSVSMQSVSFCPSVTHAPAIAVMAEIVPMISAIKLKMNMVGADGLILALIEKQVICAQGL